MKLEKQTANSSRSQNYLCMYTSPLTILSLEIQTQADDLPNQKGISGLSIPDVESNLPAKPPTSQEVPREVPRVQLTRDAAHPRSGTRKQDLRLDRLLGA